MDIKTAHEDVLKMLKEKGGRMEKNDLLRSFTGGEMPEGNLAAIIIDGIRFLEVTRQIRPENDYYVVC